MLATEISNTIDPYYTFPAIRGIQAGREYYSIMCPLKLIPKLFYFNEEYVLPQLRAQRTLNKARIPAMTRYIVDNPEDYAFSSITASIDGQVHFAPVVNETGSKNRIGELRIPMTARILINDGQHRRVAIEHALKERPELEDETISVVLFLDSGLKRSQQLFSDLNQYAIRPTKSLSVLYDHRDGFSRFVLRLIDDAPLFKDRVELERETVPDRSLKLFTLNAVYHANIALLGKKPRTTSNSEYHGKVSPEQERLAHDFWVEVTNNIPEWKLLVQDKAVANELRKNYVHSHSIGLHALGRAGHALMADHPAEWKRTIKRLGKIDWSRSNAKLWEGRAMVGGMISKSRNNLLLTTNVIKRAFDLPLTKEEQRMEAFLC